MENLNKVYIRTTLDDLELPVAIADSPTELARFTGTKVGVILSSISHKHRGWYRVEIEEEDDEK